MTPPTYDELRTELVRVTTERDHAIEVLAWIHDAARDDGAWSEIIVRLSAPYALEHAVRKLMAHANSEG